MKSLDTTNLVQLLDISPDAYNYSHNLMFVLLRDSKKCAHCSNDNDFPFFTCKECNKWSVRNPKDYLVIKN